MEEEHRKEVRMTKLRHAILTTLEVGGVLTLAVMAPNMTTLLGSRQKRQREQMRAALTRLAHKGLVTFDGNGARITKTGELYLQKEGFLTEKHRKWDRKWRVVIFDIAETRKQKRNRLRDMLVRIGFFKLQNSVWVYPYDREELIALIKLDYRLHTEVLYMIVDKIERDLPLRKHFRLT